MCHARVAQDFVTTFSYSSSPCVQCLHSALHMRHIGAVASSQRKVQRT